MRDRTGRRIDYLRISVTDRCNMRCLYCMPESGVPCIPHADILTLEEIVTIADIIDSVVHLRKIRITGGEPLVRQGVTSLVARLSHICETVMTTNGILLPDFAEELARAGLSRVNISLDSLRDDVLRMVTRRDTTLTRIEEAVMAARTFGLEPVKVNCVVLLGINTGELADMILWAASKGVTVRFIEHMPMEGSVCGYFPGNAILEKIEADLGSPVKLGIEGTSVMYRTPGGEVFGVIAPVCTDMCSNCSRLRLTADGNLLPCLAGGDPLDLKTMLRTGADRNTISERIEELVLSKPPEGR